MVISSPVNICNFRMNYKFSFVSFDTIEEYSNTFYNCKITVRFMAFQFT